MNQLTREVTSLPMIFVDPAGIRRSPALACGGDAPPYGLFLWVVRIVLLTCVALHITAAVQLTRMNSAARPDG